MTCVPGRALFLWFVSAWPCSALRAQRLCDYIAVPCCVHTAGATRRRAGEGEQAAGDNLKIAGCVFPHACWFGICTTPSLNIDMGESRALCRQ